MSYLIGHIKLGWKGRGEEFRVLDTSKLSFKFKAGFLFATLIVIGVAPLSIVRFWHGEYLRAAIDALLVLVAVSCVFYAYVSNETKITALVAASFFTATAVVVAHLYTPFFVFWLFPAMFANFFLVRALHAVVLSVAAIIAILPVALRLGDLTDSVSMVTSLLFAGGIAYTCAHLTERQHKLLQEAAVQDSLTKLGNRRAMDEELNSCIEDFSRIRTPATLIEFDLDFFKKINDDFGHDVGDKVLVDIASVMQKSVRRTDRIFRFGGEEFIVLARNTTLEEAATITEKLRQQVENDVRAENRVVTASFGCAQLREGESKNDWFVRADKAVYQAKEQGRNCVVLADKQ
jgi:diguanylate cyclase (GGDEF)-like protein